MPVFSSHQRSRQSHLCADCKALGEKEGEEEEEEKEDEKGREEEEKKEEWKEHGEVASFTGSCCWTVSCHERKQLCRPSEAP